MKMIAMRGVRIRREDDLEHFLVPEPLDERTEEAPLLGVPSIPMPRDGDGGARDALKAFDVERTPLRMRAQTRAPGNSAAIVRADVLDLDDIQLREDARQPCDRAGH